MNNKTNELENLEQEILEIEQTIESLKSKIQRKINEVGFLFLSNEERENIDNGIYLFRYSGRAGFRKFKVVDCETLKVLKEFWV